MVGQMAVFTQGVLSGLPSGFRRTSLSPCMLFSTLSGQLLFGRRHVTVVRGLYPLPTVLTHVGCQHFASGGLWVRDKRDAKKRWRTDTSLNNTRTEATTTSEESPGLVSVDSEEGAPMRKWNFVAIMQRLLRLITEFSIKKMSPDALRKGFASFLRGRGTRFVLMTLLSFISVCLFMKGALTGNATQLVPYSELVEHLQSRTVTSVLFEEGSSQVYFNVEQNRQNSEVVGKDAEVLSAAEEGKSRMASTGLAQSVKDSPNASDKQNGQSAGAILTDGSIPTNAIISSRKDAGSVSQKWAYSTRRVRNDEGFILPLMRDAGVKFSSAPQSISAMLKTVLVTVITVWIPLSPLLWLLHRQISQNVANSKKKRNTKRVVKFEDVAGVDTAKAELMEIVECMRGSTKFTSLGAKIPKGVLLVGSPGTGKTLLALAVAGEAGVPFFSASASEFVEMFVGRGAARIRELFTEARKCTPSIVFIDELDAVGGRRGRSFNDERDQTLNQLLTEMDGFDSDHGVLVIAATNRPGALDPALCRPGRLSRRLHVTRPDLEGRQQVLAVHMRGVPVQGDPLLLGRLVASMTSGFVGADLASVVNEAALLAARKERTAVGFDDFKEAVDRVRYGVGDRQRNLFNEVEQKVGSWLNTLSPGAVFPTF